MNKGGMSKKGKREEIAASVIPWSTVNSTLRECTLEKSKMNLDVHACVTEKMARLKQIWMQKEETG